MENATKALLIAAGVLIAIMLITMGVAIYQMGSSATEKVNLDETTIMAHNNKFDTYEGTNVRGTNVNALLQKVLNHNQTTDDKSLQVAVYEGEYEEGSKPSGTPFLGTNATTISNKKVKTGTTYTVACIRNSSGIIDTIYIKANDGSKLSEDSTTKE